MTGRHRRLGRTRSRKRKPMTDEPHDPERPQTHGRDQLVIEEAMRLLTEVDNTPLNQTTPLCYQHGFDKLRILVAICSGSTDSTSRRSQPICGREPV